MQTRPQWASDFGKTYGGYLPGAMSVLGGIFGNSAAPYEAASNTFRDYANQANNLHMPYQQAGVSAINPTQNWLARMENPTNFVNNISSQYQESPWAHYQKQQALKAAQNFGSATGLTNSTPLMMQAQQNAANISNQDMNQWLQNVLGINSLYGQGQQNLMGIGQRSAGQLSSLYGDLARSQAEMEYARSAAQNNDNSNIFGGLGSMLGTFFGV